MKFMHFRGRGSWFSLAVIAALILLSSVRLVDDVGTALAASDPVIAAAGDIACDPSSSSFNGGNGSSGSCRQKYTSDLLVTGGFAAVLALGDIQYYCGGYQAFLQSYDLSWGRVKSITRPAVGNHEYLTSGGTDCTSANAGAAGYFNYFGSAAGNPSQGYYSYDVGAWHLIALNTNCSSAGGCGSSSPQGLWLKADLESHQNLCTLAYFHIPLFSSGGRANSNARSLWQTLYDHNADVILSGHDHIYERFAPQTANGALDTARGIRSFIVGTGGSNHTSLASIAANSELRNTDTFGILKLTLHPASYDWQFVPEAGKTFTDSGSAPCLGGSAPSTPNTPTLTSVPAPGATNTPEGTVTQVDTQPTQTFSFNPIADSYVNASSPTTNYGTSTQIRLDGSPLVRSYLRFDVRNLTGRVTRATLRVYANSALNLGYSVHPVTDNTWGETTLNYSNAPAFGNVLGSSGQIAAAGWTSLDVTSLITGDGTYNLALTTSSSTALGLASREAAAANRPQLVVEAQAIATAAPSLTATSTATSTSTGTGTNTVTATTTAMATTSPTPTDPAAPTSTNSFTPSPTDTPPPTAIDPPMDTPTVTPTDTSTPSPTGTNTPTATAMATTGIATFSFTPAADSYVNASSPTTNYGSSTQVRVDGSPLVRSYLRFNVQNLTGRVTRATLRIYANSAASSGVVANILSDNSWTETGINYNNAPLLGSALNSSGSFGAGVWISMDVTAYITGNGTYGIVLTTPGSTAVSLASRESGANAPQLIVETGP